TDELPGLTVVSDRAGDASVLGEEAVHRGLHEDVDALVHRVLLEGADHLEARAVTNVRETRVAVAAEVALEDEAVLRAIEQRAPFLELEDAIWRLLRVDLRHAPVVQELAAAHRVAEVDLPVVFLPHVPHGRRDRTLRHDRVGLA